MKIKIKNRKSSLVIFLKKGGVKQGKKLGSAGKLIRIRSSCKYAQSGGENSSRRVGRT